jgi:hypothetical protein
MSNEEVYDPDVYDAASRAEAVAAVVHHGHHPADPNEGVVRGELSRSAVVAGIVAAAVTVAAVVVLALAIGTG